VVEPYTLDAGQNGGMNIWHFDFYRFNDPREWEEAGFRDIFAAPGLKLVEWPEKAGPTCRRARPAAAPGRAAGRCARSHPDGPHARRRGTDRMKRPALNRRSALQLGSVVLLLGVQHIARGATIVAVRVWPSKDYTRLTIESDGEIKARQFFIAEPPRLAVDIEGIDLIPALRELVAKVKSDDPNISGIRVGQNAPGVVRLVIDLKQPILPQVFTCRRWPPTSTGWCSTSTRRRWPTRWKR
jgi:hypothetical protein